MEKFIIILHMHYNKIIIFKISYLLAFKLRFIIALTTYFNITLNIFLSYYLKLLYIILIFQQGYFMFLLNWLKKNSRENIFGNV